ncbi:MAG: transcriptional regulator, partial [Chloroflexi bacterium]|nr:transcriptional regulator [Chloroflexota bacterium]
MGVIHRFGEFELDVEGYELRRGGASVAVQPKVFEVLRFLVEHPERVVDKDELLDAVWPTELVNESAVAWCVSHARRALGQGKGDRGPIETVHGRGYRFRPAAPRSVPPPAAAAPPASASLAAEVAAEGPPLVGRRAVLDRLEAAV